MSRVGKIWGYGVLHILLEGVRMNIGLSELIFQYLGKLDVMKSLDPKITFVCVHLKKFLQIF